MTNNKQQTAVKLYTEDYALIVSDEQIKDVRPFIGQYHLEGGLTINKFPNYLTDLGACKLIIAHRPLTDAPILEGVPLINKTYGYDKQ
jgi:hypothetical protein